MLLGLCPTLLKLTISHIYKHAHKTRKMRLQSYTLRIIPHPPFQKKLESSSHLIRFQQQINLYKKWCFEINILLLGKDTHVQNIPILVNLIMYKIFKFINLSKCKGINIYPIHKLVKVLKANILPFTLHLPYAYKHVKCWANWNIHYICTSMAKWKARKNT